MCDSTLAIYCFIDDFLKVSGHREDIRVEVGRRSYHHCDTSDAAFRR